MRGVLALVVGLVVILYLFPGVPLRPVLHEGLVLVGQALLAVATHV